MAPVSASVLQAFTWKVLHRKYCIDACTSRRYCIVSQKETLFNIPCGVDEELEGAASIELGGAASMPAPPVGGADAVDMGGGGCTMAGGAATLGVPPSGAVRGSAFSCSTSSGAAPGGGGTLVGTVAGAGGAALWGTVAKAVATDTLVCVATARLGP